MIANYNELIPQGIVFSIKEINEMNLIKSDMLKKLIYNNIIEYTAPRKTNNFF